MRTKKLNLAGTYLVWVVATLIVITPQVTEESLWVLHSAYRRGSNVIALVCSAQAEFNLMQSRGKRLGVTMHKAVWEKDLQTLPA